MTGHLAQKILRANHFAPNIELEDALRRALRAHVLSTIPLIAELFRVQKALVGVQIATLVVKGPVLSARAFNDPSARNYGDIDFLLRDADIVRASEALANAGFNACVSPSAIRSQRVPGQYAFRRPGPSPLVELHTERTLRYFPRPLPIEDFFRRSTSVTVDGRSVSALSVEDEFVLISIHGAKHFWERLMWIADIAALVCNYPQMNWARVRKTAADVGAERMVSVALLLAERALRAPVPAEMKAAVAQDSACLPMVRKIESWLPYARQEPPALMQRALFRLQMSGRFFAGARYLTRLSLSPTEEDWNTDSDAPAASLRESLRRPFRLAKKYRRGRKDGRWN